LFCYQFSNIQVTRRYKHFDWLHQRLTDKFITIAVPPLPGKQITGKSAFFCYCLRQDSPRKPWKVMMLLCCQGIVMENYSI